MNTPTPTPRTDAAWSSAFNAEDFSASSVARSMREFSQQLETELAALTAERDQLRVDLELADVMYQRECEVEHELRTEVERLRADRTYNHECINRLASATGTLGEKSEKVVDVVLSIIDQLRAENVTLRGAQKACEACDEPTAFEVRQLRARAARAEDNLAALEQCHDDNCRSVVKIADDLAAERARLDWLQEHALAQHSEGISISKLGKHYNGFPGSLRAAIDAAMKEDAK